MREERARGACALTARPIKAARGAYDVPYEEVLLRGPAVKVRRWMKSQSLNEFAGVHCGIGVGVV